MTKVRNSKLMDRTATAEILIWKRNLYGAILEIQINQLLNYVIQLVMLMKKIMIQICVDLEQRKLLKITEKITGDVKEKLSLERHVNLGIPRNHILIPIQVNNLEH